MGKVLQVLSQVEVDGGGGGDAKKHGGVLLSGEPLRCTKCFEDCLLELCVSCRPSRAPIFVLPRVFQRRGRGAVCGPESRVVSCQQRGVVCRVYPSASFDPRETGVGLRAGDRGKGVAADRRVVRPVASGYFAAAAGGVGRCRVRRGFAHYQHIAEHLSREVSQRELSASK